MTALEMVSLLGKTGYVDTDDFTIEVTVIDARTRFGETDVLVRPVAGRGEKWVRAYRFSAAV